MGDIGPYRVSSRLEMGILQYGNMLPRYTVELDLQLLSLWQVKSDGGFRIERVGIILVKLERGYLPAVPAQQRNGADRQPADSHLASLSALFIQLLSGIVIAPPQHDPRIGIRIRRRHYLPDYFTMALFTVASVLGRVALAVGHIAEGLIRGGPVLESQVIHPGVWIHCVTAPLYGN